MMKSDADLWEVLLNLLLSPLMWGLVVLGAMSLFAHWLDSPKGRGWRGERAVRRILAKLDAESHTVFHDLTLETEHGLTQIDHLVVSEHGIWVLETKTMRGLLKGDQRGRYWYQILGKSARQFQNPLRQNYRHVRAIQEVTGLAKEAVHSVVVLAGSAKFDGDMPDNVVHTKQLLAYLMVVGVTDHRLEAAERSKAVHAIEENRLPPGRATNRRHLAELEERFSNK